MTKTSLLLLLFIFVFEFGPSRQISEVIFPKNFMGISLARETLYAVKAYSNASIMIQNGNENLQDIISLYHILVELSKRKKDHQFAIRYQKRLIKFRSREETPYNKFAELQLCKKKPKHWILCR